MKQPPTTLATPRATSSRLALKLMPWMPTALLSPSPRLLAAMDDSKKPSRPIRNEVLMASRTCNICEYRKGQRTGKGLPVVDRTSPRISRPFWSQAKLQVSTADRTTTRKRSGTYATPGYLGWSLRLSSLALVSIYAQVCPDRAYRQTMMMAKLAKATPQVKA